MKRIPKPSVVVSALWDEVTGRRLVRNAQLMLRRLEEECAEHEARLPELSGWERAETSAKLQVAQENYKKLDRWFEDYGYSKGRRVAEEPSA